MFHQEAQYDLILPLELKMIVNNGAACDIDTIATHEEISWRLSWFNILVMPQILEVELLVVVAFLLVDVEIGAVEIKQAVRQLVASQCANDQLTIVAIEHAAPWKVAFTRARDYLTTVFFFDLIRSGFRRYFLFFSRVRTSLASLFLSIGLQSKKNFKDQISN